nr:MAG TPA: hypothetical protein [Caudoviricetes sp.]
MNLKNVNNKGFYLFYLKIKSDFYILQKKTPFVLEWSFLFILIPNLNI